MKGFVYIFIPFFFCSSLLNARKTETKNLEYIYELLKDKCDIPENAGSFYCDKMNRHLRVEYNTKDEISHLGIVLFKGDFIDHFGKTICNFHERFFLELLLAPDIDIDRYCKERNIFLSLEKLTGNRVLSGRDIEQTVDFIKGDNIRYTLLKDSLYCSSTWEKGSEKAELFFPANFSLISGMDKKEADDLFEKELNNLLPAEYVIDALFVEKQDLHKTGKDLFVKYGKTMFIKEMTSNLYFIGREGGGYSLLYDRMYPEESITNMVIYPDANTRRLSVRIKHNAYGGKINEYNTNFFDFLLFLDNDYNRYIGIEKVAGELLSFTVIFQNKYYNCHHLLYVETSPDLIFSGEKQLKGTLYTYIPNHNIKDLYKKYIEK